MKRYTFTLEETQEIKAARKKNRDKNVEKRLAALEMRAEGKQNKEIREKTGFHTQYTRDTTDCRGTSVWWAAGHMRGENLTRH